MILDCCEYQLEMFVYTMCISFEERCCYSFNVFNEVDSLTSEATRP